MTTALNPIEQTYRRLTAAGKRILRLYAGNPNDQGFHFPGAILEKAYRNYFQRQDYRPHPKGLPQARQAIANYYAGQGAALDPEHLILTSGTSESFFYLFSLLAGPGDNLLAPVPAYPLFDSIAALARVELRHYALCEDRGWAIDFEDLDRKADARTRAVLLVSPNNPTGAVASPEEIAKLAAWADAKDLPLVCDEVFSEFYFGPGEFPRPMALERPKLCFTLNGLSKMFALPSLKLSWIALSGEAARVAPALDRLETIADTFLSCHIPIQEALPALFAEGAPFLADYRREVRRRRDLAVALLQEDPSFRFHPPQGGFYLTLSVAKEMPFDEETLVIRLMEEEGVFLHPGYFYDDESGTHLVLSYLAQEPELRAGIAALRRFIHRY